MVKNNEINRFLINTANYSKAEQKFKQVFNTVLNKYKFDINYIN